VNRILEVVARHGLTVTSIVITHAHIDHIGGAQKLKAATGAPVYMNLEDSDLQEMLDVQAGWLGVRTPEAVEIDVPLKDGDRLLVGATEVRVLHTPGHTQGSVCLWLPEEKKLAAGDTLFRDGIGRTDLPGGDGRQILESIHGQLMGLPGETEVFPGHGDSTTIAREKSSNYYLQR
jgi:glyoxylase-like metal-dependent hydrolase (beta-lactamase superfamily II)